MNDAEEFDKLAVAAFPKVTGIKTIIETVRDGFHPRTRLYTLELSGKGFLGTVRSQAPNAIDAVTGARKPYAVARRRFATSSVLSDCQRLSDGHLIDQPHIEQYMRERLMQAHLPDFEKVAANCRKEAQALASQMAA